VKAFRFVGNKLISFSAIKPPAHPGDADGVGFRNVGKPSHPNAAVCPRKFHLTVNLLIYDNFKRYLRIV